MMPRQGSITPRCRPAQAPARLPARRAGWRSRPCRAARTRSDAAQSESRTSHAARHHLRRGPSGKLRGEPRTRVRCLTLWAAPAELLPPLSAVPRHRTPSRCRGLAQDAHVRCLRTLAALRFLVLDLVALVQRLVAVSLDRAEVHEQILAAAVRGDEAVTLLGAEPLDRTDRHTFSPSVLSATNRLCSLLMP